nr:MAG TPA: hypothetical protein [Caudoviricetes sp.]
MSCFNLIDVLVFSINTLQMKLYTTESEIQQQKT